MIRVGMIRVIRGTPPEWWMTKHARTLAAGGGGDQMNRLPSDVPLKEGRLDKTPRGMRRKERRYDRSG